MQKSHIGGAINKTSTCCGWALRLGNSGLVSSTSCASVSCSTCIVRFLSSVGSLQNPSWKQTPALQYPRFVRNTTRASQGRLRTPVGAALTGQDIPKGGNGWEPPCRLLSACSPAVDPTQHVLSESASGRCGRDNQCAAQEPRWSSSKIGRGLPQWRFSWQQRQLQAHGVRHRLQPERRRFRRLRRSDKDDHGTALRRGRRFGRAFA